MKRVLILFAHPALERSRVNRRLAAIAQEVDGVTVHDLYETYPDFDVDPAREQALLSQHDVIVMQHPFYWYSTPAILKQWQDLVLELGWAFGPGGNKLEGKILFTATSTGGRKPSYQPDGQHGMTMPQLLAPIDRTAKLCNMRYLAPFVVFGTHKMTPEEIRSHAENYRTLLRHFVKDQVDVEAATKICTLNSGNQIDASILTTTVTHDA